jgi:hypothetical protein
LESSQADDDMGHDEPEVRQNVDLLVEKMVDALDDEAGANVQGHNGSKIMSTPGSDDGVKGQAGRRDEEAHGPSYDCVEDQPLLREGSPGRCRDSLNDDSSLVQESPASPTLAIVGKDNTEVIIRSRFSRASSCPPSEDRHALQGSWSWEWLQDNNHGETGVIFTTRKRAKHGDNFEGCQKKVGHIISKKAGGTLRHPVLNMKKIARLSN